MAKSGRQLVTFCRAEEFDPDANPKLVREVLEKRTQLTSESGFMMVFGEPRHRHVSARTSFILGDNSYPVSEVTYNSLPAYIRAELERDGEIQVLAQYYPDTGEFEDVILPDEPEPDDLFECIALHMDKGLSLHQTIDYLAVEITKTYSDDEWATVREVSTDAIKSNIEVAKEAQKSAE